MYDGEEVAEFTVDDKLFSAPSRQITGREVRTTAGHNPAADWRLIQIHDGYTSSVGLEDPVHIGKGEVPAFRSMKGDREFDFLVNDRGWEWGSSSISDADVRRYACIGTELDLILDVVGQGETPIPRGSEISLSGAGIERIYSREPVRPSKLAVTFVINGVGTPIEGRPGTKLLDLLEKALQKSENTGQPATAWQVTDEPGNLLDEQKTLAELGISDGAVLLANLRTGAAG